MPFWPYILSRASEAGSATNRSGSDKTRGQGSFGPSTGGPDLHVKHLTIGKLDNHLDKNFKKNEPHIWFAFFYWDTVSLARHNMYTNTHPWISLGQFLLLQKVAKGCKVLSTCQHIIIFTLLSSFILLAMVLFK